MIRNKLYDELEKEGYSFSKLRTGSQSVIPKVFHLEDTDDWAFVNPTMIVNGQPQIVRGPTASQKTINMLQRVLNEVFKPDFYDWISKAALEQIQKNSSTETTQNNETVL